MVIGELKIECRAEGPFMKNGYVLTIGDEKDAVYIDPGDEVVQVIDFIRQKGLDLKAIVATHAHMDHICGIRTLKQEMDVPIYLHQDDEFIYSGLSEQSRYFGMNYEPAPPVDAYMEDGSILRFGSIELEVFHTPGHSPGGVCLKNGRNMFTGDLIFAGSVGRTDLPGGDMEVLMNSIRRVIVPLPAETVLWPGHGPKTTSGHELERNPFRNSFLL